MNQKTIIALLLLALITLPLSVKTTADSKPEETAEITEDQEDEDLDDMLADLDKDLKGMGINEDGEQLEDDDSLYEGESDEDRVKRLSGEYSDGMEEVQKYIDQLTKLLKQDDVKQLLEADPDTLDEESRAQQAELMEATKLVNDRMDVLNLHIKDMENSVTDEQNKLANDATKKRGEDDAVDAENKGLNDD